MMNKDKAIEIFVKVSSALADVYRSEYATSEKSEQEMVAEHEGRVRDCKALLDG